MRRIRLKDEPEEAQERHAFGYNDTAGRAMGAIIYTWMEPDGRFGWRPHASRDGRAYGPNLWMEWYETEAERTAAIGDYLERARKFAELIHTKGRRR